MCLYWFTREITYKSRVTCEIAYKNQLVNKTFEILFHKHQVTYWKTGTVVKSIKCKSQTMWAKRIRRKEPSQLLEQNRFLLHSCGLKEESVSVMSSENASWRR